MRDDEGTPGGPFRSWWALYASVVVWASLWVLFLYVLTATLNLPAAGPGP